MLLSKSVTLERFQVRKEVAIRNHIFVALYGYIHLQHRKAIDFIVNFYQLQRDLFKEAQGKEYLDLQYFYRLSMRKY